MGRDIHYCDCGEEIFDDMESCWKCATKTERGALSELRSSRWLDGRERRVEYTSWLYGCMTGMMIVSGAAAVTFGGWAIIALPFIFGIAGEAFRRMLPPKPSQPSSS